MLQRHVRRGHLAGLAVAAALIVAACAPMPGDPTTTTEPPTTTASTTTTSTTTTSTTTTTTVPGDPFDVTFRINGTITASQRAILDAAAARVGQVVTQGLPDVAVDTSDGSCGPDPIVATVDDLFVDVSFLPLSADVNASAGPCNFRGPGTGSQQPAACFIWFNSALFATLEANGTLEAIATHELLHCLGFGTSPTWNALVPGRTTSTPSFTGPLARAEWQLLGGTGDVPLFGRFGANVGHWPEDVFGDELMTPIAAEGPMPLSRLTIAALGDLGYTVDPGAADAYSLPAPGLRADRPTSPGPSI